MSPEQKTQQRKYRRAAIRHATFTRAPVWLSRGRLARVRPGRNFCLAYHSIPMPQLPSALDGLKITHLSDPHIGELVTPAHLPHMVDATNRMGGDLIAVTGDFIDFSNKVLPAVVKAMGQLKAPLGVYFVLGNHDYLDNVGEVICAFQEAGLNLLINSSLLLRHKSHRIAVAGIDWAQRERLTHLVNHTAATMPKAELNILLAHHPHAFDAAVHCNYDLVLAGHTHGGHVLLSTKRGKKGSIGLANLAFRYTRGLYQSGQSHMYVSNGVGSWFPLRFRCPAEITLLELRAVKAVKAR